MAFDREIFVRDCRAAALAAEPLSAVREVVSDAVGDGSSIDAALGRESNGEPVTLFASPELTVQRIQWPPGLDSSIHEHRMWAVVGVYDGEELNRIFERSSEGVSERDRRALRQGDVLVLDSDAIHAVENPLRRRTAGVHVYGGDIQSVERSAWGPDGREVPFATNAAQLRAMFGAIRDVAQDHQRQLDDEARYLANTGLRAACERERRYPTDAEARCIIEDVWKISA